MRTANGGPRGGNKQKRKAPQGDKQNKRAASVAKWKARDDQLFFSRPRTRPPHGQSQSSN